MTPREPIPRRGALVSLATLWLGTTGLLPRARAQATPTLPRIGVIYPGLAPAEAGGALERFRQGLRSLGHVEGQTLKLEVRWDEHRPQQTAEHVLALLRLPVDVLVTGTSVSALAAKRATNKVPIVMAVSADPVGDGLITSLAQPGGNLTGLSIMNPELTSRRLQMLTEAVPGLARVALLLDTSFPRWVQEQQEHELAARTLGLQLLPLRVAGPDEFAAAFTLARQRQAQGLILMQCPMFSMHRASLAALAQSNRLPAVSGSGDGQFARAGGLMNYGANLGASWERAATYVHKILQGARPAELPVEQPSRFELVINRKSADTLGITMPSHLLLLADEVIR